MSEETQDALPNDTGKTSAPLEPVKAASTAAPKVTKETVMSWPNLLVLEILACLGTTVLLFVWSFALDAPLRELANPDVTENPAKAAWYFMSLQELLIHMHPALAGVIIPGLLILALMAIPYIDRSKKDIGIWFASKKGRAIALWSAVYTAFWLVALTLFDQYYGVRKVVSEPDVFPAWIVPIAVLGGLIALLYFLVRRWRPNTREVLIGLFTAFAMTYVILTISGVFFRGYGMNLTWPWDLPPGALTF